MASNALIGKKLRGLGNTPSEIMVVCDQPTGYEYAQVKPFSDKKWNRLKKAVKEAGLKDVYYTYLVKYNTKTLKASDVKACIQDLIDEIVNVKPKLIICPGSFVLTGIATNKYPISRCRGSIITAGNQKILPIYDLTQIDKSPELWPAFIRDLKLAAKFQNGESIDPPKVVTTIVHTAEELKQAYYDFGSPSVISLDCEWDGRNWMDPNRYFRTIQLGLDQSCAIVIEVSTEGGVRCCEEGSVFKALKEILEKADIIGQNIIADGEWLLSYGIDIRKNVIFDTMLAEYILNSDLPVGLEELSMRYTDFGRYSTEVELWTHQNARKCKTGYGNVPRELLMSYAGYDVCCLFPIMQAQLKELVQRGYIKLRGNYPSLFNTTMRTQEIIYELEINGMPVDIDRLKELIDIYQAKKAELLGLISTEAAVAGMESFNPNSTKDKQTLLYDKLGIAPVRTTDGKDWGEAMDKVGFDYDTEGLSAGTDKNTLAILATKHPVAKHLIWYNAVSQVCKTWLKYPDEDGEGGLIADLWEDGKLHPRYSQLTQTGRLRVSQPNSQNMPKRAEGVLAEVFKDNQPPLLRTIVKPPTDWVMIEGDFSQAELFTLANLSGDPNMLRVLNTPGMDLHDKSAVDGFGFHMEDENGNEVTLEDLVRIAKEEEANGGEESERFQHLQKSLIYIAKDGKRYTRSEFKSGPRIAAKAISFSVPYGIGAPSLAFSIKSQTGDSRDLGIITAEVSTLMESWKTKTFPTAWNHLVDWQRMVYNPGWIENPWGRRKWLRVYSGETNKALEREAGNFPMQSTVSDTIQIASDRLLRKRKELNLGFRLQNQIHDALMLEVPKSELEQTKQVLTWAMSEIDIPTYTPGKTFRLACDIDEYVRWGEKASH